MHHERSRVASGPQANNSASRSRKVYVIVFVIIKYGRVNHRAMYLLNREVNWVDSPPFRQVRAIFAVRAQHHSRPCAVVTDCLPRPRWTNNNRCCTDARRNIPRASSFWPRSRSPGSSRSLRSRARNASGILCGNPPRGCCSLRGRQARLNRDISCTRRVNRAS